MMPLRLLSGFFKKRFPGAEFLALVACLCGMVLSPAMAEPREAKPLQADHRVRAIMYQPDAVFKFVGHYGFQSAIEFGAEETISTISMGDSTGWILNPSGNRLFLKPVDQNATTNMTLITNRRVYLFELHAAEAADIDDASVTFIMRFIYSGEDSGGDGGVENFQQLTDSIPLPDLERNPGKYNFNYTISGAESVAPIRIFDDGQFTFFQFRNKNTDLPGFFTVDSNNEEAIVNYRARGDYIVVERVAPRFTLRYGNDIVCVFNEGGRK